MVYSQHFGTLLHLTTWGLYCMKVDGRADRLLSVNKDVHSQSSKAQGRLCTWWPNSHRCRAMVGNASRRTFTEHPQEYQYLGAERSLGELLWSHRDCRRKSDRLYTRCILYEWLPPKNTRTKRRKRMSRSNFFFFFFYYSSQTVLKRLIWAARIEQCN